MSRQLPLNTLRPFARVLDEDGVKSLHNASLEILEGIGIEMQDSQGRELLLAAGAWESGDRIKIPERLINESVARAPSRIPIHNQDGKLTMPLELGKVYFGSGSDTTFTLDIETGERRRSTAADAENLACVADAMANFDFVMSMSNPSDVPEDDLYLHAFMGMLRGSNKPIVYVAMNRQDIEDIYRLAVAVAGSEQALREAPFLINYSEPISPLLFPEESLQKLIFCAEKGIPACYPPSTNTGAGGPITLAGAVALGNAESLVGLILTQLVRPGAPFLYGFNTAALDMKTTIVSYGAPEWSLGMMAGAELARFYNLPVWGYAGATDSKVVDAQAGAEMTMSIMSAFLSRCTLNHDVGYIEYGGCSSAEAMVIADEIIDMVRSLMSGLEINDTTLALEAIEDVQPGSGFLAEDHTLDHWRDAQWLPGLFDRSQQDEWEMKGSKDAFTRANERAQTLLAEHKAKLPSDEVERLFKQILDERANQRE